MTLEDLLKDRIAKGEMTHFSLSFAASPKKWCATYTPSHQFETAIVFHADPITAAVTAIEAPKTKRVRSKHDDPRGRSQSQPEPAPQAAGGRTDNPQIDAGTDWFREAGA